MIVCWIKRHKFIQTKGLFNNLIPGSVVCERCGKSPKYKATKPIDENSEKTIADTAVEKAEKIAEK